MNHKKQVTGYQIFCGSHLLQRVRSASRTKALLHGTCHVIIIIIGVVINIIAMNVKCHHNYRHHCQSGEHCWFKISNYKDEVP